MIHESVFSPAFGNRPSQLVGRDGVIQAFLRGLRSAPGSKDRAMFLRGQRGSGKTVLLWELADRARDEGFVVASPTVASDDMLDRVIEKVQDDGERYLRKSRGQLAGAEIGVLGFSAGLQFSPEVQETKTFQYKLSRLCERLNGKGKGVLILLDEVQANSPDVRRLVSAYSELVGEGRDVALGMAGLPSALSATMNDRVLTFLNRARKIDLEPLDIGEVDAYYARAFRELGVGISPALRRRASEATKGSPYMMQLVGYNLCLYAQAGETVDDGILEDALHASRVDFQDDVCKTTLASLSGQDRAFLQAMSCDAGDSSSVADVAERMGVSVDYAQKYRRRLIDAGIVEPAQRGFVAFSVPYLKDYLRQDG